MWSIACLVNTVDNIPNECLHDLFDEGQAYEGELWDDVDCVVDEKGHLLFNPDHMEHMDYIGSHPNVVKILKRYNVAGDICFSSLEGDNAGKSWGYRFDGKGGMKKLDGNHMWKEKSRGLKGKTFAITGSFKSDTWMTREDIKKDIEERGGRVTSDVSSKTDYLIVGDRPGSKLKRARQLGIPTLSFQDFLETTNG